MRILFPWAIGVLRKGCNHNGIECLLSAAGAVGQVICSEAASGGQRWWKLREKLRAMGARDGKHSIRVHLSAQWIIVIFEHDHHLAFAATAMNTSYPTKLVRLYLVSVRRRIMLRSDRTIFSKGPSDSCCVT